MMLMFNNTEIDIHVSVESIGFGYDDLTGRMRKSMPRYLVQHSAVHFINSKFIWFENSRVLGIYTQKLSVRFSFFCDTFCSIRATTLVEIRRRMWEQERKLFGMQRSINEEINNVNMWICIVQSIPKPFAFRSTRCNRFLCVKKGLVSSFIHINWILKLRISLFQIVSVCVDCVQF